MNVRRVVVVGGGPGGYEAALVAAQLGASVTVIDRDGPGGSAVLTDCVPSKALIAAAAAARAGRGPGGTAVAPTERVDLARINAAVRDLAAAQSDDIARRLERDGVRLIRGTGRLSGDGRVTAVEPDGAESHWPADTILLATGASARRLPDAPVDGHRILDWTQVYNLREVPERIIVVGSGVTGAEFADVFAALGAGVVLVSSRPHVLPGEDPDAAAVVERGFAARGIEVLSRVRALAARVEQDGVAVTLGDGRTIRGSHCLMAVGSVPNSTGLGLPEAGVATRDGGWIDVDRVSRTSTPGIYAAGDVTGVHMLASVAAMQGRIAMWHALGEAVTPLDLGTVCSNVFTTPEIATVGMSHRRAADVPEPIDVVTLPLATNPRAKMTGITEGFVKLFSRAGTGVVVGGVVVAPRASELIHSITLAVTHRLTVDQLATTSTVYPSMSGSVAEAARRLHPHHVG